ncbi:MAG: cytochrome c3 family protein [Deltaproteobacteria bacterium]|nr:cytochrome c3 family protein [Deltaproteobacteria bacterium]
MNGRSLGAIICVLFVVGIVFMIAEIPKAGPSGTTSGLFEPVAAVPQRAAPVAVAVKAPEKEEAEVPKGETQPPAEKEKPSEEKPKPAIKEPESEEPPETVEFTPSYGRVIFTHTMHFEDYGLDCGDCHHEDLEGGMTKCINCHEPPKKALHKNCLGCHKKLKAQGKDTGPVKCRECHIKKAS